MGKYMTLEERAKEWRENYKPMGVTCVERYDVTVETQARPTKIIENPNPFRIKDGWYDLYLKDLENAYIVGAEENKPTWHYTDDLLPPDPQEDSSEGFTVCKALIYICAYKLKDGGYETGEFMYLGNGEWVGENEEYPIYAWLDCPMTVPRPREEG